MSRARVAVLKVISKQLSVTTAAAKYGYSRQHLHRLVARYRAGGLEAVEARSRRPRSNPRATEDKVRDFIIKTRLELTAAAGTPTLSALPGTRNRPGCTSRRPRPSAGSCTPPAWYRASRSAAGCRPMSWPDIARPPDSKDSAIARLPARTLSGKYGPCLHGQKCSQNRTGTSSIS